MTNIYFNIDNDKIDNFWKFISVFTKPFINNQDIKNNENILDTCTVYEYRRYLINTIKKKYTVEEFYLYESILNNLLLQLLKKYKYINKNKNCSRIMKNCKSKSYAHKYIIYNENNDSFYYLDSYPTISNKLAKLLSLFRKREYYENAMTDNNFLKKYKFIKYYYPDDYPFPNVNVIFYNQNSKELWISNIKRLYYSNNCEKNWYINKYIHI